MKNLTNNLYRIADALWHLVLCVWFGAMGYSLIYHTTTVSSCVLMTLGLLVILIIGYILGVED